MGAIDAVRRGVRRIFGQHEESTDLPPGPAATALAAHLARNDNATFVWCGCCHRRLVGIVSGVGDGLEAISLGCPLGHGALQISCGIVLEPQSSQARAV